MIGSEVEVKGLAVDLTVLSLGCDKKLRREWVSQELSWFNLVRMRKFAEADLAKNLIPVTVSMGYSTALDFSG